MPRNYLKTIGGTFAMTPYQPEKQIASEAIIEAPTRPNGLNNSRLDGIPLSEPSSVLEANTGLLNKKPKISILGLGSIGNRHFQNFKELGCDVRGYDNAGITSAALIANRNEAIDWADAIV